MMEKACVKVMVREEGLREVRMEMVRMRMRVIMRVRVVRMKMTVFVVRRVRSGLERGEGEAELEGETKGVAGEADLEDLLSRAAANRHVEPCSCLIIVPHGHEKVLTWVIPQ